MHRSQREKFAVGELGSAKRLSSKRRMKNHGGFYRKFKKRKHRRKMNKNLNDIQVDPDDLDYSIDRCLGNDII